MSDDKMEDVKDRQEIHRQKEKQNRSNENMAKWEYGKGIVNDKDVKENVRSKIQQESH